MTIYAGLDVSDKTTHICVVDAEGAVLRREVQATDPDVLAKWLAKHCKGLVRVVLETGPLSTFLYHGLVERSVPVICICARHAKKALSARVNKSDVNDAESLAQLCRTGWFKPVHMKAGATHIALRQAQERRARDQGADGDGAQCFCQSVARDAQTVRAEDGGRDNAGQAARTARRLVHPAA
jgi:transposase